MRLTKKFEADGMLGRDGLFTITLPAHEKATDREHSWRMDWIKSVAAARESIDVAGDELVVSIDFATGPPQNPGKDGAVVIKSYESGGEILRFESGAWQLVGRQPPLETRH